MLHTNRRTQEQKPFALFKRSPRRDYTYIYILKYTSLCVCVRSVWARVCVRLCFVLLHNLQLNLQLTRPSQLALNFIIYAICWQTTQDVVDDDDDDDDAAGHGTKDTQNECLRLPYARGAF